VPLGVVWPAVGLEAGVTPFALALTFVLSRLIELASTNTLSALTLRLKVASALSFSMLTPNAAPTPTLPPAAEASAPIVRSILFEAVTETSPEVLITRVEVPR